MQITKNIPKTEIDAISGVAGAIPVLIQLFKITRETKYIDTANRYGLFLMSISTEKDNTLSWKTVDSQHALTGYSHGNAGIAVALLDLYTNTNDTQFLTAAEKAFNYERQWFNPQENNWPDLREHQSGQALKYGDMWCHGAPGIALSRLKVWTLTQKKEYLHEANIALNTTYRIVSNQINNQQMPANYSLCHGVAGNADILLTGAEITGNQLFAQLANHVGFTGLERYENTGLEWPSGVNDPSGQTPGKQETPNLMLGKAGTGYFYLRLANPAQTPSLLVL